MSLRDKFSAIGSKLGATFRPEHSLKTYVSCHNEKRKFIRRYGYQYVRTDTAIYKWAEARRTKGEKYSIQEIEEVRHGRRDLFDDNMRTTSQICINGQKIFTASEAREILRQLEMGYRDSGYYFPDTQPFKAQHFSNGNERPPPLQNHRPA